MPPALMQGVRATRTARRIVTLFSEHGKIADSASSRCSSEGTVWDGSLLPLAAEAAGREAQSYQSAIGIDAGADGEGACSKRRTVASGQYLRLRARSTRATAPGLAQVCETWALYDGTARRRQDQVAVNRTPEFGCFWVTIFVTFASVSS